MKELVTQTWEIKGDGEYIKVNFDRVGGDVSTEIVQGKSIVLLDEEQTQELFNILKNTTFIFNQ